MYWSSIGIVLLTIMLSSPLNAANCKKGIPCGNSCIAANKTCRIGTSSATTSAPTARASTATATTPRTLSAPGPSGFNSTPPVVREAQAPAPAPVQSAIPVTAPVTPTPRAAAASTAVGLPGESKWLFQAEGVAKGAGCVPPHAVMTAKGAGQEMFNVTCPNGTILAIRCDLDGCRLLR